MTQKQCPNVIWKNKTNETLHFLVEIALTEKTRKYWLCTGTSSKQVFILTYYILDELSL